MAPITPVLLGFMFMIYWVDAQNTAVNPGSCPSSSDVSICANPCSSDAECPSTDQKCCQMGCGPTCVRAVTSNTNLCATVMCVSGTECDESTGSCVETNLPCPALECVTRRYCRYGYEKDDRGCQNSCECYNPCDALNCDSGKKCEVMTTRIECITTPCENQHVAECVQDCPRIRCDASRGCLTKTDTATGCPTCDCDPCNGECVPGQETCVLRFPPCARESPREACEAVAVCETCPESVCANCEFGVSYQTATASNGCPTCRCNVNPCRTIRCDSGTQCRLVKPQTCTSDDTCYPEAECQACPDPSESCPKDCQYGTKVYTRAGRCPYCRCAPHLCRVKRCERGETCSLVTSSCLADGPCEAACEACPISICPDCEFGTRQVPARFGNGCTECRCRPDPCRIYQYRCRLTRQVCQVTSTGRPQCVAQDPTNAETCLARVDSRFDFILMLLGRNMQHACELGSTDCGTGQKCCLTATGRVCKDASIPSTSDFGVLLQELLQGFFGNRGK